MGSIKIPWFFRLSGQNLSLDSKKQSHKQTINRLRKRLIVNMYTHIDFQSRFPMPVRTCWHSPLPYRKGRKICTITIILKTCCGHLMTHMFLCVHSSE